MKDACVWKFPPENIGGGDRAGEHSGLFKMVCYCFGLVFGSSERWERCRHFRAQLRSGDDEGLVRSCEWPGLRWLTSVPKSWRRHDAVLSAEVLPFCIHERLN